jgi:hypothetical protein
VTRNRQPFPDGPIFATRRHGASQDSRSAYGIEEKRSRPLGKLESRRTDYARGKDVKGFFADVLSTNSRMIGLFKGGSDHVSVRREEGTVEITMLF